MKLTSVKNDKNCNCISPFYINNITGINPNTGRDYSTEDLDVMKTSLYRISNAKGCNVSVCCDPNDPTTNPDAAFTKQFIQKFPKIMPIYQGSQLQGIKLSTIANVKTSGWQDPSPHMICKITKATITDTSDPTIKMATNLVNDCYSDSCSALETITVNTLLQNSKPDMTYTTVDDARVSQAIMENNMSYVKEYIRKYKGVNFPLTNDDYNNRLIHIAAGSAHNAILTMLIALKANLNIQNKLRETPIHIAVFAKNLDNISSLLGQGVDLTIPNTNGETAMFYAMKTGDLRIINMLYTNNSPIQGVDKNGNNLIHHCVLYCPSYKDDDFTVPNSKSEIIQFLIEHGISTEQKNNIGISPLEMVDKQINKEINTECSLNNKTDDDNIIEKFFGSIPPPHTANTTIANTITNTTIANTITNTTIANTTNTNDIKRAGAVRQNILQYTPEHLSLLDIQTKLFNNIIQNNPNKYKDYISVDDLPIGAPIEILDTVCVGNNMTGNEDSEECIAKGGKISKITNKTTKIKLELLSGDQSDIDTYKQNDLYYPKAHNKIPIGTIPINVINYNASVKANSTILPSSSSSSTPNFTTGITYDLGANSTNTVGLTNTPKQGQGQGQGQGQVPIQASAPAPAPAPIIISNTTIPQMPEHPSMFEEDNTVVHKCKWDAINNSNKIANTKPILTPSLTPSPSPTATATAIANIRYITTKFIYTYKAPIGLLFFIIILLLIYIYFVSHSKSVAAAAE